jgi:hypothetical protein
MGHIDGVAHCGLANPDHEDLRSKMKGGKIVFAGGPRNRTDRAGPTPSKRKRA